MQLPPGATFAADVLMLLSGNMTDGTPGFSLELSGDLREMRDWVHEFAASVMRPAAAEWDEREQTPWPILQEAAGIGLYGWQIMATLRADETGQSFPILAEELFWGDGGIGLSMMGTGLAAAGIAAAGTVEQTVEWVPQCYGTDKDVRVGAFCSSESEAGWSYGLTV